ncbi:hypothetical protein DID80_06825, partial [Candidatus Marinamargulisbacteria bacterium SCGC AAA071-K20]
MLTRLLTGSLLLVVTVSFTLKGDLFFTAFVAIISLIMAYESLTLYKKKPFSLKAIVTYCIVLLSVICINLPQFITIWTTPYFFILIGIITIIHLIELSSKKLFLYHTKDGGFFKTILLLCSSIPFLILLRNLPNGLLLTLYLCAIIWACDTGAYF